MTGVALALVLQASTWIVTPATVTVGDTVRLARRIVAPPEVVVRLSPLEASPLLQPLAPPRSGYAEGTLTIVYTVALFEAGRHAVALPSAELIEADGTTSTLPGDTAWVTVRSVLPTDDSLPPPRPSLGPLARAPRRLAPLAVLTGVVLIGLGGWTAARRRSRPRPPPPDLAPAWAEPPVDRWMAAGESRAVASLTAHRVRAWLTERVPAAGRHLTTEQCLAVLAGHQTGLPLREIASLLRALERAQFSPAVSSDVGELVERADRLVGPRPAEEAP